MLKRVGSWSKPGDNKNLIARKKVDCSLRILKSRMVAFT